MLGGNSAKKAKTSGAKVDTLIGHETEIHGDVHFSGGLHVDGVVKGNVYAQGEGDTTSVAIVSERGRVEGELRVPHLLINGYVAGDVYASERLDLARNARVRGDVYYHTIEMAGGAEVNGKLVRSDEAPQRFLEHQAQAAEPAPARAEAEPAERPAGTDREQS
ncbi:MAG: polymer-forming cytoskeletal protein [Halofilum sp. (in: g-proteobacteria)]|nr:polymer-forming cytoskeletal protein [Halofilum sp. (in: g-proteobacteria)]